MKFPYHFYFNRFCVHCKEDDENTSGLALCFPPFLKVLWVIAQDAEVGGAVVYQNHTDKSFFVGCSSFRSCRWSKGMD
jgi:hypothetical protein